MAGHIHILQMNFLSDDEPKSSAITSLFLLNRKSYFIKGSEEKIYIKWTNVIDCSADMKTIKLFTNSKYDCKIINEFVTNVISEFCTKYNCNISWKMLC